MRVDRPEALRLFRGAGLCEWCGHWLPRREAHHVFARGQGDAARLDVPENLIALCALCHGKHHNGRAPTARDLLATVAARERCRESDLLDLIYLLRRHPKVANDEQWQAYLRLREGWRRGGLAVAVPDPAEGPRPG